MPKRIQRKRTKGWRMPDNCVCVSRPTKWGNPFRAGDDHPHYPGIPMSPAHAVEFYRGYLRDRPELVEQIRMELSGKDVACWCSLDAVCHGDVLLEIANSGMNAEVARLQAENARLRKQVEQLSELVNYAVDELRELPELNMANYDESDVSQLNSGVCAIFGHLEINSAIIGNETEGSDGE